MTVENILSLLKTKTSEEIAKEFSNNLNAAIQMKAEEEAKAKKENERQKIRIEILEDMMTLIEDYLYLSDYKYPNEEEVDLREVDKIIQDFLAMTETVGNSGWLSFLMGHPTTGFSTKDTPTNTKETKDTNPTPAFNTKNTEDTTDTTPTPADPNTETMIWEELINFLFDPS